MTRPELFYDAPCCAMCGELPATVDGEECEYCYAQPYISGEREYDPNQLALNGRRLWDGAGYRDVEQLILASRTRRPSQLMQVRGGK